MPKRSVPRCSRLTGNRSFLSATPAAKTDLWKATRADAKKPWWLNFQFNLERLTDDGEAKSRLAFSPDGSKLAYVKGRGDLWVADAAGKNARKIVESWNAPSYDWSPDGKWLVYAQDDDDFNRDIWIKPLDGARPPFNLSRHPYNEDDPIWSPDGRVIAFVGARESKENVDIHFVFLRAEDDQKNSRDRSIEKALEKMQKGRNKMDAGTEQDSDPQVKDEPKAVAPALKKGATPVVIDFDGIRQRIHRVTIPHSHETDLIWSPDSKKLAFSATVDGQLGAYTIEVPDRLKPALLNSQTGAQARWLKNGQIVWLSGGIPASISGTVSPTSAGPATTAPAPRSGNRASGGRAGRGQLSLHGLSRDQSGQETPGGFRYVLAHHARPLV